MSENKITYQEAFEQVNNIIEKIEAGEASIDELSEKVKQASKLLAICRKKLKSTEDEVQHILDNIENNALQENEQK